VNAALAALLAAAAVAGALPPEHRCPVDDAGAPRLREGEALAWGDLLRLRELLPAEVWRHRHAFFDERMQLLVGACHRRYAPAEAHLAATERFAGRARLDGDGNLHDHVAGLPFPPDRIDPAAPDAALRWAWNFEHRHRAAGPRGHFRLVDFPGGVGGIQTYHGTWFQLVAAHRADLAASHHRVAAAADASWIAGGRFTEPSSARHLAWRQERPGEVARRHALPDDTFVYVPTLRKVKRAPGPWSDGLFTPRYRDTDGSGDVAEDARRGFTALSIRPNAYVWRLLEVRETIAPLAVARVGYPQRPARDFGESGLSLASDRWDVRQAVVIQGALREGGRDRDFLTLWIDAQTQQPLYAIARRRGGQVVEVGILAHRYSGDVPGYPSLRDGAEARVFDPVAAVFVDTAAGGGWRRESYDLDSTPPPPHELERMLSSSYLERGR